MAAVGVAGAGLMLGHWLAYALGTPHAQARDRLLAATGHSYLHLATEVALLAATLGLVVLFLGRLSRREARGTFGGNLARLAGVQVAAFVAMEIGERLLSGAPLHDLSHGPVLAVGIGVQLALVVAGAVALRLTERAADVASSLGAPARRSAPSLVAAPLLASSAPARRPEMRAVASRAPPCLG